MSRDTFRFPWKRDGGQVVRKYKKSLPPFFYGAETPFNSDFFFVYGDLLFSSLLKDYHPDLGMECLDYYAPESGLLGTRWRGIRFENARHKKELTQGNTLYVKV